MERRDGETFSGKIVSILSYSHKWQIMRFFSFICSYYPPINIIGRFSIWDKFSMPRNVDNDMLNRGKKFAMFIKRSYQGALNFESTSNMV